MNVFFLDQDPVVCAKYHVDKHVVKMIVEQSQILSTAHRILDGKVDYWDDDQQTKKFYLLPGEKLELKVVNDKPVVYIVNPSCYNLTHVNHPCSIWARQTSENYLHLVNLTKALLSEYTYRYDKVHKTSYLLENFLSKVPKNIPIGKLTPPALAMDDDFKINETQPSIENSILSYRNYYAYGKVHLHSWKNCPVPNFLQPQ